MSAVISNCGAYRYRLERTISNDGPTYAFFGVNPSTADAAIDDATVRKWRGFVSRWGGSRFIVGNLFAFRSTDVKALARAANPIGPDNFSHLQRIISDADILVPCWGNRSKLPGALRSVPDEFFDFLLASGKPVHLFGRSKSGDPLHPLMLGYATQLVPALEPHP
jgi:hypothetical protein